MASGPKALDDGQLDQASGGVIYNAGGGADTIITGDENQQINGGAGADLILTGVRDDLVLGGGGADLIATGWGQDTIDGGAGNDAINAGSGSDIVAGGGGDDIITGGNADGATDIVDGGAGDDDYIWTHLDGNDAFEGGNGHDGVMLPWTTLEQLQEGLRLNDPSLTMQVSDSGRITFLDAAGQPATFSGTLTIGTAALMFGNIEYLSISPT
jgi:hypothetical protein